MEIKKRIRYFETYISKILKKISINSITSNSRQQLNSALCTISRVITNLSVKLTISSGKRTVSIKEISNAIKFIFPDTLAELYNNFAEESVKTFNTVTPNINTSSRQDKAGIIFPPSITEKFLRNFGFTNIMISKNVPVYLASILEYITISILTSALKYSNENNRIRITIRDLELSVRMNEDLSKVFEYCKINFIGGGVIPSIHESLLNKKNRTKRKQELVRKNHRFRPGTVCLREIRKIQKTSNCLIFSKFPFERFSRSIINNYSKEKKISKEVFIILQYYIEQFIVDFLKDANSAAIHCGRVKLMPSDIQFICNLRKYDIKPGTECVKEPIMNPITNSTLVEALN